MIKKMAKQTQLPQQQQDVKPLDVTISIVNKTFNADVHVVLKNPINGDIVHTESFKMLGNVPLENYVTYTFGMYNALRQNKTKDA